MAEEATCLQETKDDECSAVYYVDFKGKMKQERKRKYDNIEYSSLI
jgi:hypothetical protein